MNSLVKRRAQAFSFLIALLPTIFLNCSQLGTPPKAKHLEEIQKSPQYDLDLQKFVNKQRDIIPKMYKQNSFWKMFALFLFAGEDTKPKKSLPIHKPDLKAFMGPSSKLKFIWFGHSTFMVNMNGRLLLFDPVLSEKALPIPFFYKRFQAPVLSLRELPQKIDFIVISHDHYDHLDMETVKFFQDREVKFIVPLGLSSHLRGWGISKEKIIELDWWQSRKVGSLEFICTPAQHFSGRTKPYGNETLWASWVIRNKKNSLYFSGDSGYDVHFREIGRKYGPFDLAFIENGQYDEMWAAIHMLPKDSAQAFLDLRGKEYVPVHWGMFDLSIHSWYDPIEAIEKLAKEKGIRILTPKLGQIVQAGSQMVFEKWWKKQPSLAKKAEAKGDKK